MSDVRFDEQVAIVTGAGRGLGRQYALDLAARGAKVVVNDFGGDLAGADGSPAPAAEVVAEIEALGGTAVADTGDVRSPADRERLVGRAVESWGRVDVLVNNAGIPGGGALLGDLSDEVVDAVLDVNLHGAVGMARQVWPHMSAAGYGRIVNITSHSIFGTAYTAPYVISRTAHLGLTTALAAEGAALGIKVNAVMPAAYTRMTAGIPDPDFLALLENNFGTQTVSPAVVLLASDQAPCSGEFFHSGGGLVARVAFAVSQGAAGIVTAEDFRDRYAEVSDLPGVVTPASVDEVMGHVFSRALGMSGTTPGLGS